MLPLRLCTQLVMTSTWPACMRLTLSEGSATNLEGRGGDRQVCCNHYPCICSRLTSRPLTPCRFQADRLDCCCLEQLLTPTRPPPGLGSGLQVDMLHAIKLNNADAHAAAQHGPCSCLPRLTAFKSTGCSACLSDSCWPPQTRTARLDPQACRKHFGHHSVLDTATCHSSAWAPRLARLVAKVHLND
jgi:hypothetical protein